MKLHQLSNGDWIDPETVSAVLLLGDKDVVVCRNHLGSICIGSETRSNAERLRDEIAREVNSLLETEAWLASKSKQ